MRIETEELIIRNYVLEDKEDLGEYMLQRVNEKFEGYPDFDETKLDAEIENRCKSDEFFAIELKKEHKVIGNIYLGKRDFNTRELGYVLNKNYLHMGYGSAAALAAIRYAFSIGVHRIYAETCPENNASWKTMEKIGMEREAYFKKNVSFFNDEEGNPIYWDTYVYALLNPMEQIGREQNDNSEETKGEKQMKNISVESERLIIRPRSIEEMEQLYQNEKDPEMKQAYFEMYEEMKKIVPREEWAADWEICLKDGTSVGGIGFKGIPNEKGEIEVGYGIDPEHQRNGYATEAVGAMMKWAFDQEDVIVFQGQTEPHNEISKKVLRKNGLVEVGMGYEGPLFEIRNPKRK